MCTNLIVKSSVPCERISFELSEREVTILCQSQFCYVFTSSRTARTKHASSSGSKVFLFPIFLMYVNSCDNCNRSYMCFFYNCTILKIVFIQRVKTWSHRKRWINREIAFSSLRFKNSYIFDDSLYKEYLSEYNWNHDIFRKISHTLFHVMGSAWAARQVT